MLRKSDFGAKLGVYFGVKICMNVYCIVMFEFNYSVGDIRNSDLEEGIICSGEGSGGKGDGSGGKWGGKWGMPTPLSTPSLLVAPFSVQVILP